MIRIEGVSPAVTMKTKCFILIASIQALVSPLQSAESKPNVLFIAVDDMRCDLGCYGVKEVLSPNLDRLANSGVLFKRAYCQLAVCNPSRASLMTGLRPDTTKVWDLPTDFRTRIPDAVTIPQHFRKHGYQALGFGKIFHNPFPDNVSWDAPHEWPKGAKTWSEDAMKKLKKVKDEMRAAGEPEAKIERLRSLGTERVDIEDSEHFDGAMTDQAIAAMRELSGKDQPFFLAAGFIRPHLPFVVPTKYWDLYDPAKIKLAPNGHLPSGAPAVAFGDRSMGGLYELRDYMNYRHVPSPFEGSLTVADQRELKHGYYASVSFVDAQVGRLLDELDRLGLAENTIVVLWSDHGWKLGEHNGWCKQTNYEIDTRAPLMIRAPGAKTNGTPSNALVEFVDIYPTLCELASLPVPKVLEGKSLVPLLNGAEATLKDAAFSQFPRTHEGRDYMGCAIRTETHRYIEWRDLKSGKVEAQELYDHQIDPEENQNIAGDPKQEDLIAELSARIAKQFKPANWQKKRAVERPQLTIVNNGRQTLEIFWLAEKGERKKSGTLAPGERQTIKTTVGHRFLIEGAKGFREVVTVSKAKETHVLRSKSAGKTDSPNILFLMADDWSAPHAGFLGDPVIKTPTLDRIAHEGVVFENAFVSSPSCTPSRLSIATGQWHWRLKEGMNLSGSIREGVPVYPEILQAAGYEIGHSRKGAGPSDYKFTHRDPFGKKFKSFEEFMELRNNGAAFCFWYGAGEPHRPYRFGESEKADMDLSKLNLPACLPDNKIVRRDFADYLHRVQTFDSDCAAMIALLEARGELDNTIIVVSGDNGLPFPRCKATLYDTGTHVPLAIRWGSKVKGGRRVSDFTSLTDLAPTFLEAAGAKLPKEMTGRSLLPILLSDRSGQVEVGRSFVLTGMEQHVYAYPSRAIRTADFLYIRNFDPESWRSGESTKPSPKIDFTDGSWPNHEGAFSFNTDPSPTKQFLLDYRDEANVRPFADLAFGPRPEEELYDVRADPGQLRNLATDRKFVAQRDELRDRLAQALKVSGDPFLESRSITPHAP